VSIQRLKIALVSDAVLPFHKGGKETRTYHLSKELVRLGQEVHVYTMKWWDGDDKTYVYDDVTYHALCRLYPLYKGNRRSIKEGVMFGVSCLKMISYDFDIIETDHMPYFPLFFTKIVTTLKRKPLYATWHEVVGWKAWKAYIGVTKGSIAYIIERLSIMLPNHIIAVSEHTQKQLRDVLHYKGKLSLVSNGIDYTRIEPIKAKTEKSDIVYAGRLIPHKNVDLLIESIKLLKEKRPNIRCVIVGGGPEYERLQAMVVEQKLEKNVTLTGRLESSDDVYAYMKASKLFVSPSTREGFGITILEAIACGLSVVTVKHKDNLAQYLVSPETGIVCDLSAKDIAESIDQLLTNPLAASSHTADAASYDWSRQAADLEKAYGL
jgi:glycosyltransferase involved in cell wall biosynthesis